MDVPQKGVFLQARWCQFGHLKKLFADFKKKLRYSFDNRINIDYFSLIANTFKNGGFI